MVPLKLLSNLPDPLDCKVESLSVVDPAVLLLTLVNSRLVVVAFLVELGINPKLLIGFSSVTCFGLAEFIKNPLLLGLLCCK